MVAFGRDEFTRQDVRADSRQARAAANRRPRAVPGIADQRDPTTSPPVHHDLADRVEVKVVRAVQLVEQAGQLPTEIAVQIPDQAALGVEVVPVVVVQIVRTPQQDDPSLTRCCGPDTWQRFGRPS